MVASRLKVNFDEMAAPVPEIMDDYLFLPTETLYGKRVRKKKT
jgi:hypothetical protein